LPGASFWGRWGRNTPKAKDVALNQPDMAVARTRLLTLVYGDMETIRMVRLTSPTVLDVAYDPAAVAPYFYGQLVFSWSPPVIVHICLQELDGLARDWTKPPPDAIFTLRVPVEFASLHAAVSLSSNHSSMRYITLSYSEIGGGSLHLCSCKSDARDVV
jgi:hypothetical protein